MTKPTDAEIDAALKAYWARALHHAQTNNRDYDAVMHDCMRAALIAARDAAETEGLEDHAR